MKISSAIIGFAMICIGIFNFAGNIPFLGIHPAVWFILGAGLLLSDAAWKKLSRDKDESKCKESTEPGDSPSTKSAAEPEPNQTHSDETPEPPSPVGKRR